MVASILPTPFCYQLQSVSENGTKKALERGGPTSWYKKLSSLSARPCQTAWKSGAHSSCCRFSKWSRTQSIMGHAALDRDMVAWSHWEGRDNHLTDTKERKKEEQPISTSFWYGTGRKKAKSGERRWKLRDTSISTMSRGACSACDGSLSVCLVSVHDRVLVRVYQSSLLIDPEQGALDDIQNPMDYRQQLSIITGGWHQKVLV